MADPDYAARTIAAESGGDPSARNPNSSAGGLGQFIDATWLAMLAKHRPDIQGTPQELLALKFDPALSRAMTDAYAKDNGAILQNAGLPVTPGSTYLAHFAGPGGAVKVLQSDPNAPVSDILGAAAVNANPFLRGMTAGQLQAWADRKMGGPATAAPQASLATAAIPSAPAPIFAQAPQPQAQPEAQPSSLYSQMPVEQLAAPPPIFVPPRKPIDLAKLKAAFAPRSGGFFMGRS